MLLETEFRTDLLEQLTTLAETNPSVFDRFGVTYSPETVDTMWAIYQKSVMDYDIKPEEAAKDALQEVFGIPMDAWPFQKVADKEYQVKLYYGFQECVDDDIYHAFEAVDPADDPGAAKMTEKLAAMLHTSTDDERFSCSSMLIRLPQSVVDQIGRNYSEGA